MPSSKKPTALIREVKVNLYKKLDKHVPADTRRGYTDNVEALSTGLFISFKRRAGYPTDSMKAAVLAGANLAKKVIWEANSVMNDVMIFRKDEPQWFTDTIDKHFKLRADPGRINFGGGETLSDNTINKKISFGGIKEHDRRWVLEQVRQKILSISFHLNTGIYLIDIDNANRDISMGKPGGSPPGEEGYISPHKEEYSDQTWRPTKYKWTNSAMSGILHGEIHVAFANLENYSPLSYARVIIHEASHKYLNTDDHAYANRSIYSSLSIRQALNNADSIAWAGISLFCKSVKMPDKNSTDWDNC